jgi:hypothetical protein
VKITIAIAHPHDYITFMTMNITKSPSIETISHIHRLSATDITYEYVEAFLVGYYDRTSEELDKRSYVRVERVKTVLEMFYKAGYILAHHDIALGAVHKNITDFQDLRDIARNYLIGFNVRFFCERNS